MKGPANRTRARVFIALASTILFVPGLVLPAIAKAETRWISDNLMVPVRSGPSSGHRILHRGLPSGTALEVLSRDEASGYVEVRTASGIQGWVESQYLADQPVARDRLVRATARIEALEKQLAGLTSNLRDVRTARDESSNENDGLERQVAALQTQLAELERISASAIETNTQNLELKALNERLRAEVDDLVAENQHLDDNMQERWMLIGGGLAFAGLIAGVAIKARPRRSGWS